MKITKQQAVSLLNDCSTSTMVVGGEEGEELNVNNKLGVVLLSHGITPWALGYNASHMTVDGKKNVQQAGEFLKEWGELLLSEEAKKE